MHPNSKPAAFLMAFLVLSVFQLGAVAQQDLTKGCPDPTIIKSHTDGLYYIFSTGRGLPIRRSKDLVTWEGVGR